MFDFEIPIVWYDNKFYQFLASGNNLLILCMTYLSYFIFIGLLCFFHYVSSFITPSVLSSNLSWLIFISVEWVISFVGALFLGWGILKWCEHISLKHRREKKVCITIDCSNNGLRITSEDEKFNYGIHKSSIKLETYTFYNLASGSGDYIFLNTDIALPKGPNRDNLINIINEMYNRQVNRGAML